MVRLGLSGCGRIGRAHADSIDVRPRTQLAYVHDPSEAAAREVGARFGAAWGTDVDALIEDPAIGALADRVMVGFSTGTRRPAGQGRTASSPRSRPARCRPPGSPTARPPSYSPTRRTRACAPGRP